MNPNREVYDPEPQGEPVTRPDLHALEGGGQTTEPARGHLHPVENNPETSGSEPATKSNLRGLEGGGQTSEPTRGHLSDSTASKNPGGSTQARGGMGGSLASFTPGGFFKGLLKGKKRKGAAAGGLGLGIIGLIIGFFLTLIPLKIEHIVQNLENHYFSSSNSAVGTETDTLMGKWITGPLASSLKGNKCSKIGKTVISKNCNFNIAGNSTNPVVKLYKTWAQAHLENELSDNYGVELVYDASGPGTYYLKAPGISGEEKIGTDATGIEEGFAKADRSTVRQTFRNAEEGMTFWKKMMFRYKVGRLLEEKFGIKRCIVYCGKRDPLADKIADKKYAAKMFLVERVIAPKSAATAAVIDCLLNSKCDTEQSGANETCAQSSCEEKAGAPETAADAEAEHDIGVVSAGFGQETASTLIKGIADIRDAGGPVRWLVGKVLEKLGLQQFSDFAGGLVTWIPKLAHAIDVISKAGPDVKKLNYIVNSSAAVSLYMMYRTYADEIHTGHADITELGSFNNSLASGSQCAQALEGSCGQQLGGTANAEAAPMYSTLMDGGSSTASSSVSTSFLNDVLPSKAYANAVATTNSSASYLCNNGKPVPAGQQVCPEENFSIGNATLTALSNTFNNSPVLSPITSAAKIIYTLSNGPSSVLGGIIGTVMNAIGFKIPSFITNAVQPLITDLATQVVNQAIGPDMSGARTFDMMAAGADVSGNDYAHTGLGGQVMTPTQSAMIENQQETEAQQDFSRQPLFARLFNTNSEYSLVSKVAMDLPFGFPGSLPSSFAGLFENPFGNIASSFATIFSGKVSAANPATQDAFGITQYGYPNGVPADPQSYWDQYCTDDPTTAYQKDNSWNTAASNTNDPTGLPENTSTNPCLLIKATVGSAGGAFDTSNLTTDDTADLNGGASGSSSTTSTATAPGQYQNPLRDVKQIWFRRIDQGVDYGGQGPVYALGNGTVDEVYHYGENSGWPLSLSDSTDGGWVSYTLTDGPAAGQVVYVAESCNPTVTKNQQVNTNTVICQMNGMAYPWIETGWANGTAGTQALAAKYGGSGGSSTYSGLNFAQLMNSLGAPNATPDTMNGGPLPANFPKWN